MLLDEHLGLAARRLGKLFSGFVHQVRVGLGRWEGAGPYVVRAEDRLLQIRLGPGMKLLSLRPHLVAGSAGVECFIHCREGSGQPGDPADPLVAVYRHGTSGAVARFPGLDHQSLGILSDSYVAVEIARTLIREAHERAGVSPVMVSLRTVSPHSDGGHVTQAQGRTCP